MAARKPSERRHGGDETTELNLTPIMNIICILIPFLLLTASFFKITILPVAAPKYKSMGVSTEEDDKNEKPLNLTVAITKNGYRILTEQQVEDSGKTIPLTSCSVDKDGGNPVLSTDSNARVDTRCYNLPKLYEHLYELKTKYEKTKIVHLSAEPDTKFKYVAATMDATRFIRGDRKMNADAKILTRFASYDEYLKSHPKLDTCTYPNNHPDPNKRGKEYKCFKPLFPQVVFTVVE